MLGIYRNRAELREALRLGEVSFVEHAQLEKLFDEQESCENQGQPVTSTSQDVQDKAIDRILADWKAEGRISSHVKVPKIETRHHAIEMIRKLETNSGDMADQMWARELRTQFGIWDDVTPPSAA